MDRFLDLRRAAFFLATTLGLAFLLAVVHLTARAGSYSGTSTAYAFGASTGAFVQYQMAPGQWASHWYNATYNPNPQCLNDPAWAWPTGTWITNVSPAPWMTDGDGTPRQYSAFQLTDWGDPSCGFGSYWADLYFGRWKMPGQSCTCSNATELCYETLQWVNNCQEAVSWGARTIWYTGP